MKIFSILPGSRTVLTALTAAAMLFPASPALASHIDYDPYADSVQSFSGNGINNPQNAVGAPDGGTTSVIGINRFITLDMGSGEEGTDNLRVYFGQLSLQSEIRVEFLDSGLREIKQDSRSLTIITATQSQDFSYDFDAEDVAYRYVRLTSTAEAGFSLDAVQASGYIGSSSSVDTDGDGCKDRDEQHGDTDPQVVDCGGSATPTPTKTPTPTATASPTQTPTPRGSPTPAPTYAAPTPLPSNDRDRDGMDDSWEQVFNFNINSAADAGQDADGDGLTNAQEYHFGSDPRNPDTDGDGMPDKWEIDNGLQVNYNDANQDPDHDGFTNLEEYHNGTDPHQPDLAGPCRKPWYHWLIGALLLLLAAAIGYLAGSRRLVLVKKVN